MSLGQAHRRWAVGCEQARPQTEHLMQGLF